LQTQKSLWFADVEGVLTKVQVLSMAGEFDMESIQTISAARKRLCDVFALSECKNLTHADLSFNKLSTLEALSHLPNIVSLNVTANQITNIGNVFSIHVPK